MRMRKNNVARNTVLGQLLVMERCAAEERFGAKGDAALRELYGRYGSQTAEQKINVLETTLGMKYNFSTFGGPDAGEVSSEAVLGCLECEYLSRLGVIDLVLA